MSKSFNILSGTFGKVFILEYQDFDQASWVYKRIVKFPQEFLLPLRKETELTILKDIPFIQHFFSAPWKIFNLCQVEFLWNHKTLWNCLRNTLGKALYSSCVHTKLELWKLWKMRECWNIWGGTLDTDGVLRWKQQTPIIVLYTVKKSFKEHYADPKLSGSSENGPWELWN